MFTNLVPIIITGITLVNQVQAGQVVPQVAQPADQTIAEHQFSLGDRYPVASVNEVFKKNILLNLAYLRQTVTKKQDIQWPQVEQSFHYTLTLHPGDVFAFHDNVLPQYDGKVTQTTHAHFDSTEGFVSDGYLVGDGVCHLASLINWVAQDAHLNVLVTKNHNFAVIAEVPKAYGVSIYADPTKDAGAHNNLYITNDKDHDVTFHFDYENNELQISVTQPHTLAMK